MMMMMPCSSSSINIISSAEAVGSNDDLLTEILVRLPTRPLLKFKSVSKQWLSLISDHSFCASHTRFHPQLPHALFLVINHLPTGKLYHHAAYLKSEEGRTPPPNPSSSSKVWFFDYLKSNNLDISQSCNGLFLCRKRSISHDGDRVRHDNDNDLLASPELRVRFFICNPATKRCKVFTFTAPVQGTRVCSLDLVFDPLKSPYYKVVCVHASPALGDYYISIYSSHTGSWTCTKTPLRPYKLYGSGVLWNGSIHWYHLASSAWYLDLHSESFRELPKPPFATRTILYFGESRGHLHLVMSLIFCPLEFDVWEISVDYSTWFVKYHVNFRWIRLPELYQVYGHEQLQYKLLALIRAEKEENSLLVVHFAGKIFLYNLCSGTVETIYDGLPWGRHRITAYEYFETLTCV